MHAYDPPAVSAGSDSGSPTGESSKGERPEKGEKAKSERTAEAGEQAVDSSSRKGRPPGSRSVGWALIQAARLHRARTGDRLAKIGLFAGQEQVVQVLASAGTMTMGDLAALLRVRPPTASKTITRLAALGIVERRAEAGDGRIVQVRLTDAGLTKAQAIEQIQEDVEAELLDHLDKGDRRRLRKLLRKAAKGLAQAAGQSAEIDPEFEGDGEDEVDALAP